MVKIKKGDFIEIGYVGKVKNSDEIFDLTDEEVAKKNNLYNKNFKYGPIKICVGQNYILKKLDEELIGKETGKDYRIEINSENAFGKKDPKLLKIMNTNTLRKSNINPFPGLRINVDNLIGTIRSVNAGRVIVDFNHPLASRDIYYELKVNKLIETDKEKVESVLEFEFPYFKFDINIENNILKLKSKKLDDKIKKKLKERILELVKEIKDVEFINTTEK